MEEDKIVFTENIYLKHLATIDNVKFTPREIDIIACLLNARRTSQIAFMLSISPRTVTTHFRNIMLRLDCNSQEGIINFIERSHKLPILRKYYTNLVIESAFGKALQEISKLKREEIPTCVIVYWQNENLKNALIHRLRNHLNQACINAEIQELTINQRLENVENLAHTLLLFLEKKDQQEVSKDALIHHYVDLIEQKNYYFSVFDILKKLLVNVNFDSIFTNFKDQYEKIKSSSEGGPFKSYEEENLEKNEKNFIYKIVYILKAKKRYFLSGSFIMCLLGIGFFAIQEGNKYTENLTQTHPIIKENKEEPSIRSDLVLPTKSALLCRPEIISQINECLKGKAGIQTIALVGPGGAGKTTLARQYAHQQKAPVVWEINAENHENLKSSFENLAQALARADEDKKALKGIQKIKNPIAREEELIQFIKKGLHSCSNWVLIYDNVEKFSDIQRYFPQDAETWGEGKIVLTTRDINIQSNKHIDNFIHIGELHIDQKLDLLTKIMNQGSKQPFTPTQAGKATTFLEKIPPFPLDVSVAAYYLKATNAPYTTYLENITKHNKEFESVQQNLLKEAGDYTKTRHGIITLSLQNIINTHKDFMDLFLFVSILNSQNIPRDLLSACKNNMIVDNFIYHLKKHFLIVNETPYSINSTFSIHRDTQAIILDYLIKTLDLKKNTQALQRISDLLENYVSKAIEEEDFLKIKFALIQCNTFLSHNNLLSDFIKTTINNNVGYIYIYLGDYINARNILEKNLSTLNKFYSKKPIQVADFLLHLGIVYRELSNYEKANELLERSLKIYKTHYSKNHSKIARTLTYLGNSYRSLGEYEKAKNFLEQSLYIYREHISANHIGVARSLRYLGKAYKNLGNSEKAKNLLEQSLEIYNKYFPENYAEIAQTLIYLGYTHRSLGNFNTAKGFLEESLSIYKQHFSENHVNIARVLTYLGNIHRGEGDYCKAKNFLEKGVVIYRKNFGKNHDDVAWVSVHLGNVYRNLGNYSKAQDLLEQSLHIYKHHFPKNYIDRAWTLAHLGNVCNKLGHYEKAQDLLKQSLTIYKEKIGGSNDKIAWILAHLGSVEMGLGNYAKAKNLFDQSLIIQKKLYEKDHIREIWVLKQLGPVYEHLNDFIQAKEILEKCLKVHKKYFEENHLKMAWIFLHLGSVYNKLGYFEKAKRFLEQSLAIYMNNFGYEHFETAFVLRNIGRLYFLKGHIKLSENHYQKALSILQKSKHPDTYKVFEDLAELHLKEARLESIKRNKKNLKSFKIKAYNYLKQALEVVSIHFPENSPHLKRIQEKLNGLEQG